jgi:transcription-repair coupling factor (superfamily II helicase)
LFQALQSKINQFIESDQTDQTVSGVDLNQALFLINLIKKSLSNRYSNIFIVFQDQETADLAHSKVQAQFLPGYESNIYSGVYQSELSQVKRITQYMNLKNGEPNIICSSIASLAQLYPTLDNDFFSGFTLQADDIISPIELAQKLVKLGYSSSLTTEEPGTFSSKGEIFDIFPIGGRPYRLHYFDDLIETINLIDSETNRTLKDQIIDKFEIIPSHYKVISDADYHLNLRENLPRIPISNKDLFNERKALLESLKQGHFAEDIGLLFPLFFKQTNSLLENLNPEDTLIIFLNKENCLQDLQFYYDGLLEHQKDKELLPGPDSFFDTKLFDKIKAFKMINFDTFGVEQQEVENKINLKLLPSQTYLKNIVPPESIPDKYKFIKESFVYFDKYAKDNLMFVATHNASSKKEIDYLVEKNIRHESRKNISFIDFDLDSGFYYENEKLLIISENDFFSKKQQKVKKKNIKKTNDVFAEQLATLNPGDFVIHNEHGVGKYLGIETMSFNNDENDFVVIEYKGNDKVYLPVYKLNSLQKYADSRTEAKLDDLNSNKFTLKKQKARQSIKKLAFDLLELQAKRELKKGYRFSEPDHHFKEFELTFKFEETPDQKLAIDDVINDMASIKPMDRLVCGDVGFGKTEVAMRAAYKAVLDSKQVCILVPTTVLAFQHYNSFLERFKDFPVNIELLSRFKTPAQSKEIIANLAEGKVDIVIGTHKLLSDKIKYHDLGLVIVDEEHRFGVGHKEKLKLIKENVDFLTMTATPIPRTLQMSFLGIKDFSLIKTPPPNRQSIKTYIIKMDDFTIQQAIRKELSRGGQIYFVHNKVQNIESIQAYLQDLVPEARIVFAHGQMSERELEKRITSFYKKDFDILLATTIIESGIDIPSANTMIINRADHFGLAQLHQLRGRIGRSDRKAYAYMVIPPQMIVSETANKRLQALKTYADMGSGFSIASTDLEIRGSGDILGPEQSGHIANIGLELYTELLQETIEEIKGKKLKRNRNIEIFTPFNPLIPKTYITDDGLRLKTYKKLSNAGSHEALNEHFEEIRDSFGLPSDQLLNLFEILHIRLDLQDLGLKSIKVASKIIHLFFDSEQIAKDAELQGSIINFFTKRPKVYKLNPDFSVTCHFAERVSISTLRQFSEHLKQELLID